MDSLVTTGWLEAELGAGDLRILDATWFLPSDGRDARAEHAAAHIPGAVFADIDEVSDPASPLPHMLPPAHVIASRMQALGVSDGARIVVYDNSPLHSGARLWWMLRSFGARRVALLDGGLAKWAAEGRPLESGTAQPPRGHFTPMAAPGAAIGKAELLGLVGSGEAEVVDARGAARFAGEEAEPRPGLASGHMPGARNLPQGLLSYDTRHCRNGNPERADSKA